MTFKAPKLTDTINVDGQQYVLLTKPLLSLPFKDGVIPFKEIKHINLGRFHRKKGRSLDLKQLRIDENKTKKSITKIYFFAILFSKVILRHLYLLLPHLEQYYKDQELLDCFLPLVLSG